MELFLGSSDGFRRELSQVADVETTGRPLVQSATLLEIAAEAGSDFAVGELLSRGARARGCALVWAARQKRPGCLALLTAHGADPWQQSRFAGRHAVHEALANGHLTAAMQLCGDKPDDVREELLSLAVAQGDVAAVAWLTSGSRKQDCRRLAPETLSAAFATGDVELVRLLLGEGLKADAAPDGVPLLVSAGARGGVEMVEALLAAGAGVDKTARDGTTALMAAAFNGQPQVVKTLLRAGANPDLEDGRGRTALDAACLASCGACVELLRPRGFDGEVARPLDAVGPGDVLDQLVELRPRLEPVFAVRDVDVPPTALEEERVKAMVELRKQSDYGDALRPSLEILESKQMDNISAYPRRDFWAAASLIVEKDGTPRAIRITDAVSAEFGVHARRALRRYRFLPGEKAGSPVRTRITVTITLEDRPRRAAVRAP